MLQDIAERKDSMDEYIRRLQRVEQEILDEIVRVCDEFNLKYYLIGGTLLGAVRHKGFIPWDDDLDIAMPRADYDRFCELCGSELDRKYELHSIATDRTYWLPFAKIRKKNTIFEEKNIEGLNAPMGIYVDIFPLDNAKCVDCLEQRIRTKIIKGISAVIYVKRELPVKPSLKARVLASCIPMSIATLTKFQIRLMTKHNSAECDYYINFGSNYHTVKQTMLKTVFDPACQLEFEGKMYNALADYQYFLKRIYGEDYMQLPPMEKRVTHRPVRVIFDTEKK